MHPCNPTSGYSRLIKTGLLPGREWRRLTLPLEDYPKASVTAANATELEPKKKENWLREGNLL